MRQIERFQLIDRIGRELQSRMTYADIDVYLAGFGIETRKREGSWNSKWVYVKELLADAPEETIVRIADELGLDHSYVIAYENVAESRFWEPGHFRLFLSHLSTFKKTAGALQRALRVYGVSTFVAHVDIEPTKPWQAEIEAALFSMDALAAVLTAGFKESNWTDQEVGVAVGRGVLVIPIIKDLDPYGFIGKYQGFVGRDKMVSAVARSLFDILVAAPKTSSRMLAALVDTTVVSASAEIAAQKIAVLSSIKDIPVAYLQRFRDGVAGNTNLYSRGSTIWEAADTLLRSRGQAGLAAAAKLPSPFDEDDELPF